MIRYFSLVILVFSLGFAIGCDSKSSKQTSRRGDAAGPENLKGPNELKAPADVKPPQ
jgi:hypothetical protein